MKRLIALLGVLAVAVNSKTTFEFCSDNDFGVQNIEFNDIAVAGETFHVEVTQQPNRYVGTGRFHVALHVEGVLVSEQSFPICEVTQCGLQAHVTSKTLLPVQIPKDIPARFRTTLQITLNDHDGEQLTCVDVDKIKVEKTRQSGDMILMASAEGDKELKLGGGELGFLFKRWATMFGKSFRGKEFFHRMKVFADNLEKVATHNHAEDQSYVLALNEFAHLTQDEFKESHFGYRGGDHVRNTGARNKTFYQLDVSELGLTDLPDEVDWVEKGAVTPVKNQGSCGSCWAFSTTGAMEGAYYLKTGKLVSFSEQELVSCDKVDQGCRGGLMDNAFRFIQKNQGLCSESDYPYSAGSGFAPRYCKKCKNVEGSSVKKFVDVQQEQSALEQAVAERPVAIAIEADQLAFQFYRKGVLTGRCGSTLDHGVLLVGYGTSSSGTKYWKVKNSWGPAWGMKGYILLQRGKDVYGGQCGLLLSASYPVLE